MKIWVIGRNYPAVYNRMRGLFELEQAKMLARGGHDVTYIAVVFHPYKKIRSWGFTTWNEDGITVCGYSQLFFPETMNVDMSAFRAAVLRRALKKVEKIVGLPDVIHVHYPTMITDPDVVLDYQKRGVTIVCTEHWTSVQAKTINDREKGRLSKYATRADGFICVGEPLKKSVVELSGTDREITVIPNVVETIFQPIAGQSKNKGHFEFITAGRLVKVKQIDKVIRAFSALNREDAVLTIVGDGEEREKLTQLVSELHLGETVRFTGTLPREEVAKKIAGADCLICYSNLETFGVPIIEAWACGIPAISSDALGFAEYWRDGLGYIVDQNDTKDLVDKMQSVIDERETFEPAMIHQFAVDHFDEKCIRHQLETLYAKCIDRRKKS